MNYTLLKQYIDVVFREMWQRKFLCLFGFALISYSVLTIGIFWNSKFEVSTTIFADNQNILKPLLAEQAAQSQVQNQESVVKEMMYSPRIIKQVVENLYGLDSFESVEALGKKINSLREKLLVKGVGLNYIKVSYSDTSPDEAYRVINGLVNVFIRTSADEQRSQSREAFLFIDNQVKQYKDQLLLAEERLKDFRTLNFDGRDIDVDNSISNLSTQIEELKIELDEDQITISILKKQLGAESEFSSSRVQTDVYGERLADLVSQRNTLLMTYTDDYPDVVNLNYQIDDIREAIKEAKSESQSDKNDEAKGDDAVLNPLYQELRSRLSLLQTEVKTKQNRLAAFKRLKEEEFERRKRIAERGAEESELTRDYDVTMRIYEDMLERKEKARLSMTLNIEGQGVTYRIQEPALPPLNPVGLRFFHFVLLGPFMGLFGVIGLVVLYVMLDPKIRFPSMLSGLNVVTLAVIPHVKTPFTKRVVRFDMVLCGILALLIMVAYIGLAYASKEGLI
ncbi:MAG: polysaccharide chain length determinant protein (PEP-CTERM system associated) [Oleiphilaceae bacterium]|jgi:polysaccharide chain length determinant protein (PEP-CTERM system associated)